MDCEMWTHQSGGDALSMCGLTTKVQLLSFEYFTSRGRYASRGQGSKLGIKTAN